MKRILACTGFICLMFFLLFTFISCATLSKFLQLKQEAFPIKLVFLEETIPVNIPGHWPENVTEFPQSGYPLFYPVWVQQYTDPKTDIKYEFTIHVEKKKVYVILEYKTWPDPDDIIWYLFVDGIPIEVDIGKIRDLFDRIIFGG
ncbi:hypothetical protein KAR91_07265 [Candidatus Pacearchaeota archaeon]|nr:hypothetical protein [Candidatus Pacearchaeota archaeon]